MQQDQPAASRGIRPGVSFSLASVYWWVWLFGLLALLAVMFFPTMMARALIGMSWTGESGVGPAADAFYWWSGALLVLVVFAFAALAGWLGARLAARLWSVPQPWPWWAPSLAAAGLVLLTVAGLAIPLALTFSVSSALAIASLFLPFLLGQLIGRRLSQSTG